MLRKRNVGEMTELTASILHLLNEMVGEENVLDHLSAVIGGLSEHLVFAALEQGEDGPDGTAEILINTGVISVLLMKSSDPSELQRNLERSMMGNDQ